MTQNTTVHSSGSRNFLWWVFMKLWSDHLPFTTTNLMSRSFYIYCFPLHWMDTSHMFLKTRMRTIHLTFHDLSIVKCKCSLSLPTIHLLHTLAQQSWLVTAQFLLYVICTLADGKRLQLHTAPDL